MLMCINSHTQAVEVIRVFIDIYTLCMRVGKALINLHILLLNNVVSIIISWAGQYHHKLSIFSLDPIKNVLWVIKRTVSIRNGSFNCLQQNLLIGCKKNYSEIHSGLIPRYVKSTLT